jgi:hypothetical protein
MRRMFVIVALLLIVSPAWANGGTIQVSEQSVGPYLVTVFTSPSPFRAGPVDVSAYVADAEGNRVDDAKVTINIEPVDRPGPGGSYPATRDQADIKEYYSAKFNLPAAGRWSITASVHGPRGGGTTPAFEVEAGGASLISTPFLVALLLLVPLGIGWRLAQAQRQRLRQAARTGQGGS